MPNFLLQNLYMMRYLYLLAGVTWLFGSNAQAQQISDYDGHLYNTVLIGNQQWMMENLRTTHFRDGRPIPKVTNDSLWARRSEAAMCWYNNDSAMHHYNLGVLYNGHVARDTAICPPGWQVPMAEDWDSLIMFLGGSAVAGGEMKDAGTEFWEAPNTGATNNSGFSALPSGWRSQLNGNFEHKGFRAGWFGLRRNNDLEFRWVSWSIANAGIGPIQPAAGMSIRCFRPAPSSSSSIDEAVPLQLKLYPNPSNGWVQVKWDAEMPLPLEIRIQELSGKLLHSLALKSQEQLLDLQELPDGVYLISLWDEKRPLHFQRLILQR